VTVTFQQAGEGADLGGGDDLEEFCARLAEVFAQRLRLLDALGFQQLFEQRHTRSARGAGQRALLQARHIGAATADGFLQITFGDVVARTDLRDVGKCADAQRAGSVTATGRRDE
jgi:hypothetical protein